METMAEKITRSLLVVMELRSRGVEALTLKLAKEKMMCLEEGIEIGVEDYMDEKLKIFIEEEEVGEWTCDGWRIRSFRYKNTRLWCVEASRNIVGCGGGGLKMDPVGFIRVGNGGTWIAHRRMPVEMHYRSSIRPRYFDQFRTWRMSPWALSIAKGLGGPSALESYWAPKD